MKKNYVYFFLFFLVILWIYKFLFHDFVLLNFSLFLLSVTVIIFSSLKYKNEYSNPDFIFSNYWSFIIASLTLFLDFVSPNINGFLIIFFFIFIFIFGSSLEKSLIMHKTKTINSLKYDDVVLSYYLFFFSFFCSFLSFYISINSINGSFLDMFDPNKIIQMSKKFSNMRYFENVENSNLFSFLFSFSLICAFLGGFYFSISQYFKSKKKILKFLAYVALLPLFYYTFLKNQRTGMLFGLLIFFSTFLSTEIYFKNKKYLYFFNFFLSILSIILLLILYYFLQNIRSEVSADEVFEHLISALFGSIIAFNDWFNSISNIEIFNYALGEFTVNRIHYFFTGILPNKPGLFGDVFWMGDTFRSGTTIFTIFRALIEDFSFFGAIVFIFLLGFLSSYFYREVTRGNIAFLPILSLIFFFIFYSYLISILNWTSVWFSYFIVIIYFLIIKYRILLK